MRCDRFITSVGRGCGVGHTGGMLTLSPTKRDDLGNLDPEQYAIISQWWVDRGTVPPPREMMPGAGMLALSDGEPIACGFLYMDFTGSGVGVLAWLGISPRITSRDGVDALRILEDALSAYAKDLGCWVLGATYHSPGIINLLQSAGFEPVRSGLTQLFKTL